MEFIYNFYKKMRDFFQDTRSPEEKELDRQYRRIKSNPTKTVRSKLAQKQLYNNKANFRKFDEHYAEQNNQIYHDPKSPKYEQYNDYDPIELDGKKSLIRKL